MNILIKNANLISMSDKREQYEEDMDILICDNKIKQIGKNIDFPVDKVIDAKDKVIMPGLINTHAHIPMCVFRETLDGFGLQEWLRDNIWKMEPKLTDDDIYHASYLSFIEMIQTGTTTINDMYFKTDSIIKAALDTKVRLQTSVCLMPTYETDEGLNLLKELINKYKDNYMITFNSAPHSLYMKEKKDLLKYLNFAKENNINIHMHFCENEKELGDIENIHGKKPMDVLEENFNGYKTILAHCVKVSKEDIKRLSKLDVSVSHCPISNLKLGCGVADINEMIKNNINVSLGTDGQGSGSNLDLFETMKITPLLQKGIHEDPKILDAYEILKMATINGARALDLEKEIGSIEEDKLADIIILDTNNIKLQPINNIFSDIVYNMNGNDVLTTIIDGKILMENKKTNFDYEKICSEVKKIINRIKLG